MLNREALFASGAPNRKRPVSERCVSVHPVTSDHPLVDLGSRARRSRLRPISGNAEKEEDVVI